MSEPEYDYVKFRALEAVHHSTSIPWKDSLVDWVVKLNKPHGTKHARLYIFLRRTKNDLSTNLKDSKKSKAVFIQIEFIGKDLLSFREAEEKINKDDNLKKLLKNYILEDPPLGTINKDLNQAHIYLFKDDTETDSQKAQKAQMDIKMNDILSGLNSSHIVHQIGGRKTRKNKKSKNTRKKRKAKKAKNSRKNRKN